MVWKLSIWGPHIPLSLHGRRDAPSRGRFCTQRTSRFQLSVTHKFQINQHTGPTSSSFQRTHHLNTSDRVPKTKKGGNKISVSIRLAKSLDHKRVIRIIHSKSTPSNSFLPNKPSCNSPKYTIQHQSSILYSKDEQKFGILTLNSLRLAFSSFSGYVRAAVHQKPVDRYLLNLEHYDRHSHTFID